MSSRRNFLRLISSVPLAAQAFALKGFSQGAQPQAASQAAGAPDPFPGSPVGVQLPGQKWLVHDRNRPQVRKVTPGLPIPQPRPSSDAIVLVDGKDHSQWS